MAITSPGMTKRPLRVGLFGIGLAAYWPQFEGLQERLTDYLGVVHEKIAREGVEIVNLGLIDNDQAGVDAGHKLSEANVDLVFLHVTTYALSSTVLPAVRRARVPVIILNLQPVAAIDYAAFNALTSRTAMTGDWLAHCGACPVPELANVFIRSGIAVHQVTGVLNGDAHVDNEIDNWIEAARVAHIMAHTRMGLLGHYYSGMVDIYTDLTAQMAAFGTLFEQIEMDELAVIRDAVSNEAQAKAHADIAAHFDVRTDCASAEIDRAARTAAALSQLVADRGLGAMAYFFHSVPGHPHEDIISSVILGASLLTASGVPVAGEFEVKNALAMKIMDTLGAGGSFTEYYGFDFDDDVVLMGHDGPGHVAIAEGPPRVRPLEVYHGKVGSGLSVEMSVKHGPVTLLSVVEQRGEVCLVVAEGKSVAGPILKIGNTNSRYRFDIGARAFTEAWNAAGPAHHCAIGVGHVADKIRKLALLLNLKMTCVT